MYNFLKISIVLLLCGVGLFFAFDTGYLRFNYPTYEAFPIQGIDVSAHQKEIAWADLDKKAVGFVFIKATEGGDFKDQKFVYNWAQAKKQHIPAGAYHFFTFCKSGAAQAENFIQTVPMDTMALPPVIDLEFGGNCTNTKTKAEIIREIDTLQQKLFEKYQKKPIFYITEEFYEAYLIGLFPENPIWFRAVFAKPKTADERKWLFWQYGNRGHLKGVSTYIDLNVFNGTAAEFEKYVVPPQ
jgi:lysozyme